MTRDEIARDRMPTVIVPREEPLPECPIGGMRFLMASDGLYFEVMRPWGRLVKRLYRIPRLRPLPYGHIEEFDGFMAVLQEHIMPIVREQIVEEAAICAREGKEWAGYVIWDGDGCYYLPLPFKASSVRAHTDELPKLPVGHWLVGDIHSHHRMSPSFSPTDDISDSGGCKISIVLGNFSDEEGVPRFDWKARYCACGFIFSENSINRTEDNYASIDTEFTSETLP